MIIVNIMGGLGNQMFQYACGIALSKLTKQKLLFRVESLDQYSSPRSLELSRAFDLELPIATKGELAGLIGHWRTPVVVRRALAKPIFRAARGSKFITDDNSGIILELEKLAVNGAYLHGYWQSPKYFGETVGRHVRKAFRFCKDLSPANTDIIERMKLQPSIGIHIRRGDYLTNPKVASKHGIIRPDHYVNAVKYLRNKLPNARVFAFSDDPEWLDSFIRSSFENAECVSHNFGNDNFLDMQLMSNCDALVIANSSFSWWAAWLNEKPDKIIIAPKKWFNDNTHKINHLMPREWLLM